MKTFSASLVLIVVAFSTTAEADLYKWVDDKGVTHYGEVMPPEFAHKNNVLLNDQGRLIKRNDKIKTMQQRPTEEDNKTKLEQRRKDDALLNTFSSENEIDLARDRNLRQVKSFISSIQSIQKATLANLKGYQVEMEDIKNAGRKLPLSLQADITESEHKLAKLQLTLVKAQNKAATIKASYEADKMRFRKLNSSTHK